MHPGHSWDKGDRTSEKPAWTLERVAHALRGIPSEVSGDLRKSKINGSYHRYEDVAYDCGCIAHEDRGWDAEGCRDRFHPVLAAEGPYSPLARLFERLRGTFDAVLAYGWSRSPDAYPDLELRQRGIQPVIFRETHDIAGKPIWGYAIQAACILRADLSEIPMRRRLELFNAGRSDSPDLRLKLLSHDAVAYEQTANTEEYVTDWTADQIIEYLADRDTI